MMVLLVHISAHRTRPSQMTKQYQLKKNISKPWQTSHCDCLSIFTAIDYSLQASLISWF